MWHLLASISAWERVNRSSQCLLSCYSVLWYTIIFPLLIIPLISWARLFSFSSHESFPWTQPVDSKPPSYHVKHPSRLTQSHQCQVKSTSSTYLNICTAGLCVSHMVSPDGQSFLSCIYLSSIITTDPLSNSILSVMKGQLLLLLKEKNHSDYTQRFSRNYTHK